MLLDGLPVDGLPVYRLQPGKVLDYHFYLCAVAVDYEVLQGWQLE